jgi:hypothetical protein
MKKVFTNQGVLTKWAEQSQEEGRNGKETLSFDREILYSYAQPIAKIVKPDLVLITNESFSVTTSQHTYRAGSANRCMGRRTIHVPSIEPVHEVNLDYFLAEMKRTVLQFSTAQQRGIWVLDENHAFYRRLKNYCESFELKMPLTLGLYLDPNYEYVKKRIWETEGRQRRVFVPVWLADKLKSDVGLEPKDILKTRNVEIRREIVQRIGIEKICEALNAEVIDKKDFTLFSGDVPKHYELLLLDLGDGRRRPFLKMLNPSVPNCWHVEGVHPACKTVQDALNYRRYGREIVEPRRWENGEWTEETLTVPLEDWEPKLLT